MGWFGEVDWLERDWFFVRLCFLMVCEVGCVGVREGDVVFL